MAKIKPDLPKWGFKMEVNCPEICTIGQVVEGEQKKFDFCILFAVLCN